MSKKVSVKKIRSPCFFELVSLLIKVNLIFISSVQEAIHGGIEGLVLRRAELRRFQLLSCFSGFLVGWR